MGDSRTVFGAKDLNLFLGLGMPSELGLRLTCVEVPMEWGRGPPRKMWRGDSSPRHIY